MEVLVLGGTHFFGVHLVNSLLSNGHNVTIATRGRTKDIFGQKVERVIIERTDPGSLSEVLGKRYFDVVCDNIAYCSNDVKILLDTIKCGRYIMTSSSAVYANQHLYITESEFDSLSYPLKWCSQQDYPYDEAKRQAECAVFQKYNRFPAATVRFPYVIGVDDYTQRLYFYVEQIIKDNPMNLNNPDEQLAFIRSAEAGDFLAWTAEQKFTGPINANNIGTISLRKIINYIEQKAGKKSILSSKGLDGPYNGKETFSLNVDYANSLGYHFSKLEDSIYGLLDKYIEIAIK